MVYRSVTDAKIYLYVDGTQAASMSFAATVSMPASTVPLFLCGIPKNHVNDNEYKFLICIHNTINNWFG